MIRLIIKNIVITNLIKIGVEEDIEVEALDTLIL